MMSNINELIPFLKKASTQTTTQPESVASFREAEEAIEDFLISGIDNELTSQIFICYLLVKHILSLLTGDVRYHDESKEFYIEILKCLGELFRELSILAEDNNKKNTDTFNEVFQRTVVVFLKNTKKINASLVETK